MVIALYVILGLSAAGVITAIMLQSGVSMGLGAIAGGAESLFGRKQKGIDALLSKLTVISTAALFVSALILAVILL
jgi:preprotein translocase subunit SecG